MPKTSFDIRYDRRVSPEFLSLFEPEGFAHTLVELARRGRYPLDFQLRRDPKSGAEHATLYSGLTAVLQVAIARDGIRLKAHPSHQKAGDFDPAWLKARRAEEWPDLWPEVELYLERIIPLATVTHGRTEGAVQAAVSSHATRDLVVIDREVTPSFRDKKHKKEVLDGCQAPILQAIRQSGLSYAGKPKSLGNECDALAIASNGEVLAIEVKPLGAGSIAWVAAQALMYARVLQAWIDHEEESPRNVLKGMLENRRALGFAPDDFDPELSERPVVVPAVALQRGASPEMIRRMLEVREALRVHAPQLPSVEIFEASLIGKLVPLDESRAANGSPRPIGASYAARANAQLVAWKQDKLPAEAQASGTVRNRKGETVEVPYVLPDGYAELNLLQDVRESSIGLFKDLGIPWHQGVEHLPSRHLRSSQVQCVNALARMVTDPDRIRRAFGGIVDIGEVRDFGAIDPAEQGRFLTFEYVGPKDYLREGKLTRGANRTSVDAAFAYRTPAGIDELALIEWKFTETYPSPDSKADARLKERTRRYEASLVDPTGPIDVGDIEIGDLFHEPIYQLVRQQLLAWHLETDPDVDAEFVRVVHVLAPQNRAYERSYRAPAVAALGDDISSAWMQLLRRPDRFVKLDPRVFLDPHVTSRAYAERYRIEMPVGSRS